MRSAYRLFLQDREVPQYLQERMFSLASNEIYWLTYADLDRIGPRANWFDQFMVSRCKLDKQLEQGFLAQGVSFPRAEEARANISQAATCAHNLTVEEAKGNLRRFVTMKK